MSNKLKDYFFLIYLEDFADKDNEYELNLKQKLILHHAFIKRK